MRLLPEYYNISFSFAGDSDDCIREKGRGALRNIRKLEAWRELQEQNRYPPRPKKKTIREFNLPVLNFKAKNYTELTKLKMKKVTGPGNPPSEITFPIYVRGYKGPQKSNPVTMPPILSLLTDEQIDDIIDSPITSEFPCHTQTVEFGVATTSKAVKKRRTEDGQLRCILQTVHAREQLSGPIKHKQYLKDNFPQS